MSNAAHVGPASGHACQPSSSAPGAKLAQGDREALAVASLAKALLREVAKGQRQAPPELSTLVVRICMCH
jgi:hypothetical protein